MLYTAANPYLHMIMCPLGVYPPFVRLGRGSRGELVGVLLGPGREVDLGLGSLESAAQAELRVDTLNTVGGVDVLDQHDLVASGTTLTRDDGGRGKEVLPDLYTPRKKKLVTGTRLHGLGQINLRGTSGYRTWR
jgi:hypothetical protein